LAADATELGIRVYIHTHTLLLLGNRWERDDDDGMARLLKG